MKGYKDQAGKWRPGTDQPKSYRRADWSQGATLSNPISYIVLLCPIGKQEIELHYIAFTSSSSLSLGFSSVVCLIKSGMRISSVARAAKLTDEQTVEMMPYDE